MLYRQLINISLRKKIMKKAVIIAAVIVLIVVIAGGVFAYTYLNQTPSNDQNGDQTQTLSLDNIRDQAMTYIAANHTQSLPLMTSFHWTGSRDTSGVLGAETYQYTGNDWKVIVEYPVVPNPTYTVTAQYTAGGGFSWTGTCINGVIAETSCTLPLDTTITQEQVRDLTLQYLNAYHNQTQMYMHDLSWHGGRMNMGMMVGSETYNFQSTGWNVTMQYPVVPNPMYSIKADYTLAGNAPVMMWEGILQNGTMTQTSYSYHP